MRYRPRRFTADLIVFSLFFQLLPFPALANEGKSISSGWGNRP